MRPDYSSLPVSDFCIVEYLFQNSNSYNKEIIHKDEVDTFCEALLRLHYDPGFNPHSGGKTAEIIAINVLRCEPRGAFWWTSPSLDGEEGAMTFGNGFVKRWIKYSEDPRCCATWL
jgi:hypothetical protein